MLRLLLYFRDKSAPTRWARKKARTENAAPTLSYALRVLRATATTKTSYG